MSSGIPMIASTQGFPTEHRILMRQLIVFVSGFNVAADRCKFMKEKLSMASLK